MKGALRRGPSFVPVRNGGALQPRGPLDCSSLRHVKFMPVCHSCIWVIRMRQAKAEREMSARKARATLLCVCVWEKQGVGG